MANVSGVKASAMGPDDVQMHVHTKDHGTGGHWCAKIVFFSLLAVLAGLVGLIILENRGISDCEYNKKKPFSNCYKLLNGYFLFKWTRHYPSQGKTKR